MRFSAISAVSAIALLIGGCATPRLSAQDKTAAVEESLEGARYVAIGSSYAAGPLLPPSKPGAPARCGQSLNNYPTLLAERFGMVLVDRSCSGATTDHVLGPWGDIPPQIESVTPETRLVTVTIGGNDLSYVGNLFSATCAFNAKALAASGAKPKPCKAVRVPTEADYQRDEKQLNEIARRVRNVAPKARLIFVQYLTPLPAAGALCAVTPVSPEDAAIIREIGRRLAEITDRVALGNGALVIEMNAASSTHTPCDPEPWMIGAPQGYDGKQGLQWHLNKAGMQATADGIAYWLIHAGVKPGKPVPQVSVPAPVETQAPAETTPAPEASEPPKKPEVTPEGDAP
ncbi:SGNH/GDSL hydrolase family protein [Novosphingobium mangrovi (ex Huang et al. 2023)]|uniref:SGNH/GDSL hydrolase family protein n=1 Tax=Novosphingobium mangrovi (ex Huang et al. 2023) TaxID=2976432 RepID=A0ABT2I863_9SPHN|nr:SGNH/GDSL hydrolase family protein [Novosphingobium mangrovi (ex Huang et al. 2023)]MCT2400969.1 SGNH/GDSL hydrolase family protein [Novosphingobium mangrovi (ex Huang et al. 2023)]